MNPVRKSRSGIISVIAALVVVSVFWLIYLPRTEAYKTYKLEADLKKTLQAIQPPAGARVGSTTSIHKGSVAIVLGTYDIDSGFEKVKEHYLGEFARHGFVYKGEDKQASGQVNVHFCAPGYQATLFPLQFPVTVKSQHYEIMLIKMDGSTC